MQIYCDFVKFKLYIVLVVSLDLCSIVAFLLKELKAKEQGILLEIPVRISRHSGRHHKTWRSKRLVTFCEKVFWLKKQKRAL